MPAKSMAFGEIGPLFVEVHPAHAPSKEEWDAFVRAGQRAAAKGCTRALVVTAGWAPDAQQRATTREMIGEHPVRVAVVSDAPMVRGAITALSWFNPRVRAFAFKQGAGIPDALKYLDVDSSMTDRVLFEVRAMQREVGAA
jgi:ABC-type sugar transport system substrate-binding protein